MWQQPSGRSCSWEFLFDYVGLPADTPIVNAEWNRDGGCYNTGKGQTIPAGAFVAGSLITMAEMHPQSSDHNMIMSHLFSARSQLWDENSQPKGPGVGIAAYAHLVEHTPHRLSLTGPFSTDEGVDFRAIAGTNDDGTEVGLLVSYYDITNTDVRAMPTWARRSRWIWRSGICPGAMARLIGNAGSTPVTGP